MKINISNIPAGISTHELSQSAQLLGLPENFSGSVTAHVSLEKSSWQILAKITAQVNAAFVCDRCAEEYVRPINAVFDLVYTWTETERSTEEGEDLYVLGDGQKVIDVSDAVREYVLLGVPIKNLCRDDCRGLCAVCGTNLNERLCGCTPDEVDVRWSALQNLASQNEPHS
jgi:uncharacterized protein